MQIISIRKNPSYKDKAIAYFQQAWPEVWPEIYKDCINHSINAEQSLPQWYLLEKEGVLIGGAGLITNDFISRMDLYPWVCAIFINESHRGNNYGALLLNQAKTDAKSFGFKHLYLSTEHTGYYEKLGFTHIGKAYHPWQESSRIYQITL